MKRLGVFLLPLDGMLVHRRVTPSIKFAVNHLYTWVERGTVKVKCLAQEHNTMSLARARTRTAWPGNERTNHEAITPPALGECVYQENTSDKWDFLWYTKRECCITILYHAIENTVANTVNAKKA